MEILKSLFRWLYCLDIIDILILLTIATAAFLLANEHQQAKCWWRFVVGLLLICGVAVVAGATLGVRDEIQHGYMNLIPFHSYQEVHNGGNPEIYRSNFMNVVLFYPAGLLATSLLPQKWSGWCRCLLVVLVLTAMSIGIEFLQYRFALGRCEIDDVIHNALGALLGCLAALWLPRLLVFSKKQA